MLQYTDPNVGQKWGSPQIIPYDGQFFIPTTRKKENQKIWKQNNIFIRVCGKYQEKYEIVILIQFKQDLNAKVKSAHS